jgi:pyruvate/2-oxoacid:ferredoxin oxidoreductase alpha subunit
MPLPVAEIQKFVDAAKNVLVVELSFAGQFHKYLRSETDLPTGRTTVYARSGGKNLTVTEVMEKALEALGVQAAAKEEVLA